MAPVMKTTIKDDRTEQERQTHKLAVIATDKFMSGWGGASGGVSVAAWACGPEVNIDRVLNWVEGRSEMRRVRVVNLDNYRPKENVAHFHIHTCNVGHNATL